MPTANPARVTQSGPGRFNHYWCVEARPPPKAKGRSPQTRSNSKAHAGLEKATPTTELQRNPSPLPYRRDGFPDSCATTERFNGLHGESLA